MSQRPELIPIFRIERFFVFQQSEEINIINAHKNNFDVLKLALPLQAQNPILAVLYRNGRSL
jgi:hypothetical protein